MKKHMTKHLCLKYIIPNSLSLSLEDLNGEERIFCQDCLYNYLDFGAKAGWHPLYIKKIKRIGKYTKKSVLKDYYEKEVDEK